MSEKKAKEERTKPKLMFTMTLSAYEDGRLDVENAPLDPIFAIDMLNRGLAAIIKRTYDQVRAAHNNQKMKNESRIIIPS